MSITVVGLGSENCGISVKAKELIDCAEIIIVKTELQESANFLKNDYKYVSLDNIYQNAEDFDELNVLLANEVVKLAENKKAVYCVPFGAVCDNSVVHLKKICQDNKIDFDIVGVQSQIENVLNKANCCSSNNVSLSAYNLEGVNIENLSRNLPVVIYDLDSKMLASDVKLLFAEIYGDEQKVFFVSKDHCKLINLFELDFFDEKQYDYQTAVVFPALTLLEKKKYSYGDLLEIMSILRGENGCPWDREQTHQSIKANLIEESYELLEGIEKNDSEIIKEESGDVLLQAVFQAVIAESEGEFFASEMVDNLCSKLIFRHSHVFGQDKANNKDDALKAWESNKKIEKQQNNIFDELSSVSKQFPSILRCQKIVKKLDKANDQTLQNDEEYNIIYQEIKKLVKQNDNNKIEKTLIALCEIANENKLDLETLLNGKIDCLIQKFMCN